MKIVVLDAGTIDLPDGAWNGVREMGEVTLYTATDHGDDEEIAARISGASVVLTNKVPLRGEVLRGASALRLISTLATGYNVIDVDVARECGVTVCNVAGYSSNMTAQHAIALLLEVCNRVGHHAERVAAGAWTRSEHFWFRDQPLIELAGKTVGIIGFGTIGRRFGEIAHAMGMAVLANQRTPRDAPDYEPFAFATVEAILEAADVISLHCPQTPETTGMIHAGTLAQMKRGAILINTGRGGLVDEAAVADALRDGHLAAYAADVVSKEPMDPDNPLLGVPGALITPHIAWAADETLHRLLEMTVANLRAFQDGRPINVVS